MKPTSLSLTLTIAALAGPLLPVPARADAELSFSYFHDTLAPHGDWIEVGDYGYCWQPRGVAADWSPYTDGYWAYTDGGWTWVSYEDWGGITYHYGRWTRVTGEGWCWVPDYEWAPAWVSWRSSNDYVGWAPLPPEARFRRDVGFSVWVDTNYDIGPDYYSFCRVRDFGAPVLGPVCLPRGQNVTIIQNTVNITNITYNTQNTVIFNGGPNFVQLNQRVQRPIPALRLVRDNVAPLPVNGRFASQRIQGNQLAVFAPAVARPANQADFKVKPTKVIAADRVNHGWAQGGDPAEKQKLKQKLQQQHQGQTAENTPARPVKETDLSVVPATADPNAPSPVKLGKNKDNGKGAQFGGQPKQGQPKVGGADVAVQPGGIADGAPDKNKGGKNKEKGAEKGTTATVPQVMPPAPTVQQPNVGGEPGVDRPHPNKKDGGDRVVAQPGVAKDKPNKLNPELVPDATGKPNNFYRPPQPQQDDAARVAEKAAKKQQREQAVAQEEQQNARRLQKEADANRAQQENANRANDMRKQQQAEARQQQGAEQAKEARRQQQQAESQARQQDVERQANSQRRQMEAAQQQQQQANELHRAQKLQQQQNEVRRQQQGAAEAQRAQQQQRQAQQPQRQAQQPQRQAQQPQPQPQQQQPPPQRGQGNGKNRKLTPEEAAAQGRGF